MKETMRIGNKKFCLKNEMYVMGILNVTPDSFSDGGQYNQLNIAMKHAEKMIKEGAHIIDVGGESTRPNYVKISDDVEISRVVPIIKELKKQFDIPVSIDTYKSKVAKEAVLAGADLVNDIWGLKYDSKMADVIRESGAAVCIMHNRDNTNYKNFIKEVVKDLKESIDIAQKAGIPKDRIILDPGVGFAKTYEMNLAIIKHLEELFCFDMPLLLGTSKKSVIGLALDLPVTERVEGTVATTVMAMMKGCQFVRVHDVKENIRAIKMTQAIINCK